MKFSYRFLLFLASVSTSFGASLTWDSNTSTALAQDGAGTWNTTGTNWYNGTANVAFTTGDNVTFGAAATSGTAYTVTLASSLSAGNVVFGNTLNTYSRYTVDLGTNTLTLTGQLSVYPETAYYNALTNGTIALRRTSNSASAPDIYFDPDNSGSDWGAFITATTDVGTGSRYFVGTPQRNDLGRYSGDFRFDGPLTGSANLFLSGSTINTGGNPGSSNSMHFVFNAANPGFTGAVTLNANVDLELTNGSALSAANSLNFSPGSGRAALFLFGQSMTIGSLSDSGTGTRWIRNGALNATNGGTNTGGGGGGIPLGVNADSILTITQSTAGSFGGVISDGGNDTGTGASGTYRTLGLVKNGSATLTLSGANTFSGPLAINAGTLESNGTMGPVGAFTLAGGAFKIGNTNTLVGNLTAASLTQTGGDLNLDVQSSANDLITVTGAYAYTGGNLLVNILSVPAAGGTIPLVNYGTLTGTPAVTFTLPSGIRPTVGTPILSYGTGTASSIGVTLGPVGSLVWTASSSSAWDTTSSNWKNGASTDVFFSQDHVTFDDTAGGFSPTIAATIQAGSVTFNNATHDYLLSGAGSLAGFTPINKLGTGTATIAVNNAATGPVTITAGTLQVGNAGTAGSLGTATVVDNGTLAIKRSDAFTFANSVSGTGTFAQAGTGVTSITGALTYTGATTISTGTLQLGAAGTTGSIAGPIVDNANLSINRSDTFTLSNNVSGTGTITKLGANTLTLSGTNTHTGGTILSAGALTVATATPLGTGLLTLGGGTTFNAATASALTVPNNIALGTGTSTVVKTSTGQLNFTGNISAGDPAAILFLNTSTSGDSTTTFRFAGTNTFTGKVNLNRGALVVGSATAMGNASNQVVIDTNGNATTGVLIFDAPMTFPNPVQFNVNGLSTGTNDVTMTGVISGAAVLTKLGTGTLTLTGANTYTGSTTISAGTVRIGNGGTTGNLSAGAITDNGTLVFNRSNALAVTGAISGTGAITQSGSGTTTLALAATHTGATTVSAGTLNAVAGITLGGAMNLTGGTFQFGTSTAITTGTSSVASLTQSGGTLSLDVNGSFNDILTVRGDYTSTGGSIVVNVSSPPSPDTPITLVSYAGTLTGHPAVTINGLGGDRLHATIDYGTGTNSAITITFTGSPAGLFWTGASSAAWDTTTQNWYYPDLASPSAYSQFDIVTFDDSATSFNVALNTTVTPGSPVSFANSSNTYVLSGTGAITGSTDVTSSGGGTVIIATNNTYTGNTQVTSGGTVQFGNGGTTGSPGPADLQDYGNFAFNRSDVYVLPNNINGGGTLTQSGSGTLVLTGNVQPGGGLTISSGIVQMGNGGTTGTLGAIPIVDNAGLAINRSDSSLTLANAISGTGSVTKIGATTLVLTGGNSYSGGTAFSAGTISVADPATTIGSGPLNITGPASFVVTDTSAAHTLANNVVLGSTAGSYTFRIGSQLTMGGTISGGGTGAILYLDTVLADATTPFVLAPANTFTGQVTMNRGALVITGASSLGDPTNLLLDDTYQNATGGDVRFTGTGYTVPNPIRLSFADRTFLVGGTDSVTLSGVISQSGTRGLGKIGTGTLILSGANTYTGATSVANGGGILAVTTPAALSTGTVALGKSGTSGGVLELRMTGTNTIANPFTFASATGFTGSGSAHIRNVSGTNTLTGPLTLTSTGGNGINLQADGDLLTIAGAITSTVADSSRTMSFAGTGNGVVSGVIGDGGTNLVSISKSGTGTWTLSGANTFHGTTAISGGTLAVTGSLGTATAAVTVQAGGTLTGGGTISRPITITGGTIAPGNGVGILNAPGTVTFGTDSTYAFQLADWNGAAGTGYDKIAATALAVTATSTQKLAINVSAAGLANFSEVSKTFVIASATSAPTGLALDNYAINTTGFPGTGTWKLQVNGNNLELAYTAGSASGFDSWIASYPGLGSLTGPSDDADKDGIPNLVEYVLNGNPTVSNLGILPTSVRSGSNLIFTYNRRAGSSSDTTQVVQYSTDLSTWTNITVTPASGGAVTVTPVDASNDTITVTIPVGSNAKTFARLKVSK